MNRLFDWLKARPHRATVANLTLFAALLAWIGSPVLYGVVGSVAVLLAGGAFLLAAARRTAALWRGTNGYQLALTWIPGVLAIALAAVALGLVTAGAASGVAYAVGAALFGVEIALLALAAADLAPFDGAALAAGND